ncbi:MAG: TIGR02757 family protein [Nitrospira sp.]|nr:TIGR02757 family protein [Nitrospira sp.]
MMDTTDNRIYLMKEAFEKLYDIPVLKSRIKNDPVEFPHLYQDTEDIEIAGLIASALAFGRIDLFKPVIRKILSFSNGKLYDYIVNFNPYTDAGRFDEMYYRMCKGRDIACLIFILREVIRKYGSLRNLFYSCYNGSNSIKVALQRFTDTLRDIDTTPVYGSNIRPRGLLQLIPSPGNGGPCKRLNMYLRWMIRPDDGIDFGLWNKIPASVLIIPVDVHIARICRRMNMTGRKSANWAMAEEITDKFRLISPGDPVKYDFAICHLGITGKWKEVLFNE